MGCTGAAAMINIPSRFTRHQVPRATLPDLETHNRIYLIKNVSMLRATYQVRLLLYKAEHTGKKLVLRLPKACRLGRDLAELRREHATSIVVERV
jgi:hypothetical protein